MSSNVFTHPGDGLEVFAPTSGSLTATVQTVKASGKGAFYLGHIYNANATVNYIQVFDVALASSITLGTTVASYTIPIAPSLWDKPLSKPYKFRNGCHIAFTTTKTGNTAPGTALDAVFGFLAY